MQINAKKQYLLHHLGVKLYKIRHHQAFMGEVMIKPEAHIKMLVLGDFSPEFVYDFAAYLNLDPSQILIVPSDKIQYLHWRENFLILTTTALKDSFSRELKQHKLNLVFTIDSMQTDAKKQLWEKLINYYSLKPQIT